MIHSYDFESGTVRNAEGKFIHPSDTARAHNIAGAVRTLIGKRTVTVHPAQPISRGCRVYPITDRDGWQIARIVEHDPF